MNSLVQFKNVVKEYDMGSKKLLAADNVTFSINEGEFVVILGPSGAGKSTVLNLLGGMDFATSGEIIINGRNIAGFDEKQLTNYRAENVGFVFQFYNLIPTLTALENVSLIRHVVKSPLDALEVLTSVGLEEHLRKFPTQLSGGEQQRVSIARAVCKNPTMLLCDEPTGALDSETGIVILSLLQKMSRERNKTVIIVTHNAALAQAADRVIRLKNGKVRDITVNEAPLAVSEVNW
ncbi:ABC transporter ATP-binding protein [Ruminiclostridium cellobioparum]|uniref:ABC-type antimicrobial peptide transport system, ATPase component n=1 Tax=Ruminiclostridium cellobioparum subsp. termitidis CT1112 TaxID=1195236 RepID=S0FLD8_RUMCE|nr:ABC transporter ATP-binding protein [Ruminiclostridium cellobioparum]EMS69298.1 ABC-type antimicrobial peptide transport system, ATPase component [Ruminiclostridium cellobioparum subsp. termitidis CT1112]